MIGTQCFRAAILSDAIRSDIGRACFSSASEFGKSRELMTSISNSATGHWTSLESRIPVDWLIMVVISRTDAFLRRYLQWGFVQGGDTTTTNLNTLPPLNICRGAFGRRHYRLAFAPS